MYISIETVANLKIFYASIFCTAVYDGNIKKTKAKIPMYLAAWTE